jgi:Domain of unknown function (DUF5597)/Beta-galactosidase
VILSHGETILTEQADVRGVLRPQIRRINDARQLYVDGRPMFLTAGEVRNSSSSSRAWMQQVWEKCVRTNVNTVLAVVPWDLMEPVEGSYDFTIIDELIDDARRYGMRLAPLWFGAWKNGLSHYVPDWVKLDIKRFPRARTAHGNLEILSTLGAETRDVTARAFAALMGHIRERDEGIYTSIMVQVENEVGFNGDLRDRHPVADAAFASPVPEALMSYLIANEQKLVPETLEFWSSRKTSGTWLEVFGTEQAACHVFMAWHYARFVGHVAATGKASYDIPMFANAALPGVPGSLRKSGPTAVGGPIASVIDIWQAGAPAIDMLSPDIYRADFERMLAGFNRQGNPLFIPEAPAELEGAADAFYAAGQGALGYSIFGIEDRVLDHDQGPIHHAYKLLNDIAPLILEHQAEGTINSVRVCRPVTVAATFKLAPRVSPDQPEQRFEMGGYRWIVNLNHYWRSPDWPMADWGYCIAMQSAADEFLIAGFGVQIRYEALGDTDRIAAILSLDEVEYSNGRWARNRRLNGDEIITSYDHANLIQRGQTGTGVKFWEPVPKVMKLRLYSYER